MTSSNGAFAGEPFAPLTTICLPVLNSAAMAVLLCLLAANSTILARRASPLSCFAAASLALKLGSFLGAELKAGGHAVGHQHLPAASPLCHKLQAQDPRAPITASLAACPFRPAVLSASSVQSRIWLKPCPPK